MIEIKNKKGDKTIIKIDDEGNEEVNEEYFDNLKEEKKKETDDPENDQ